MTLRGIGLGVIMQLPWVLPSTATWPRLLGVLYDAVNSPALWLANCWTYRMHLPPQNEIGAWIVVPAIAMFIQWTLAGFAVGLIVGALRHARKSIDESQS
jgi:hypothetical protein